MRVSETTNEMQQLCFDSVERYYEKCTKLLSETEVDETCLGKVDTTKKM